ncbi:unnamed protein product [Peniophora sp. CBMAI 1063]|nr:hypothetical protein PENSPDRAFT_308365 [Peniophora sp. CONT]VDC02922.1 unnamed protein product [Peniophora sp. CBMAI 1063]
MHASLIRRSLGGIVPPKIAAPTILSSGQGSELAPLVAFYSKLPKGPAPPPPAASLKAKFFDGKNASGKPLVYGIIGIFLIGYTLDYQMHLKHHKNHPH